MGTGGPVRFLFPPSHSHVNHLPSLSIADFILSLLSDSLGYRVPYAALAKCLQKIEATTKRLLITEYLTAFLVLVVERAAPAVASGSGAAGKEKEGEGAKKGKVAGGKCGGAAGKGETGAEGLLKVIYVCINRVRSISPFLCSRRRCASLDENADTLIFLSFRAPPFPNQLCPEYEGLELGIGESILMKAISQSTGRSNPQVKADLAKLGDLGLVAQNSKGKQPTLFKLKALTVPQVFARFTEIANISGASVRS